MAEVQTSTPLSGVLNTDMQSGLPVSSRLKPFDTSKMSSEDVRAKEQELMPLQRKADQALEAATAKVDQEVAIAKAESTSNYAKDINEKLNEKNKKQAEFPYPEFHPTEDNIKSLGSLFSVMSVVGLMLGGAGKLGAMNALGSMTGMMKGWQEGRADLFKKEKETFDKEFAKVKQFHSDLQQAFDEYMKLAPVNREAAMYAKEQFIRQAGSSGILAAKIEKGDLDGVAQLLKSAKASIQHAETELRQTKANQETARHNLAEEEIQRGKEGKSGAVQKAMTQRSVNALGGLVSAVEALQEFPAGTTTGILPNLTTKDGMINYVRNTVGRKINPKSADQMNTLFTGIGRNLASIEASGAATGLAELSKQMQSGIYINAGTDDTAKVAFKVADIRRIAEENIAPAISSGLMSPDQQKTAQALVERIRRAIPFTVIDVIRASSKEGTKTIGESSRALVASKNKFASVEELEQAHQSGRIKDGDPVMVGGSVGTYVAPDKE